MIKDEFMLSILKEAAWKELSGDMIWTEQLLEKCKDNVDWEEVSENTSFIWTIPMLTKFKNRVDWGVLSDNLSEENASIELLEAFKDKWDWHKLSDNSRVPLTKEFLEKFKDYIDWGEVINRWDEPMFKIDPAVFYEEWKDYIPLSKLQDSRLWDEMVDTQVREIRTELIS